MSNNRLSQSSLSASGEERSTRASLVANSLRNRIMAGELEPDMQLRVQSLADHYAVALSPVREALNRLASEGLVTAHDMRGFFVSSVSEAELDELTRTRCWLNETALRQSMAEGGAAWEEEVLLSYHRLSRLTRRTPTGEVSAEWSDAHRTFHRALTTGCRSEILVGFCDQLFVQAERYRNLSRQAPAASPLQRDDEHRIIVEAVLARNADHAVSLLNDHFAATAKLCRSVLLSRDPGDARRTSA
ncbi:MAG: GntR family transcriptional regulator [Rhizobiales bacterium PAR1]|nr:MAG: GntR family transcriptional regulator [Rhizobiales bacterium PAR1]